MEIKKTERKFESLDSVDSILSLLDKHKSGLKLYIKNSGKKDVMQITNISEDKTITIVTDPGFSPEHDQLTVYGLLDKYFEMDLSITETKGPGYFKCTIENAKRAEAVRKDLRLLVSPEDVIATGFKLSKHSIEISSYNVPTSIKVLLEQFHSQQINICDIFKVDTYDQSDHLIDNIRKSGKIFFISDIGDPDTYKFSDENIIAADEILESTLTERIKNYNEKGYKSIAIIPIIYTSDAGKVISFAYCQMISKTKLLTTDDVNNVKKLLDDLIVRIKDSNTVYLHINQDILDLSKSGARLHITDENLKKYMISNRGFIFSIVFKLQAPIIVYGEIKSIFKDSDDNLLVGVAFAGHASSKGDMKRFNSYLEPMIKKYKDQLLKKRKKMAAR